MTGREYNAQFSIEELLTEEWKDICYYEGYYQISNLGRVKSLARTIERNNGWKLPLKERILIPQKDRYGRLFVILIKIMDREQRYIHHLVLESFVGRRPENNEACHGPDFNCTNNRLSNLRWDTKQGNAQDVATSGIQKGINNPQAKVNDTKVKEIREMYKTGLYSQDKIGILYGITQKTVYCIVNRKTWTHVL